MQISIPQIRHFNDLYYISVNLLHIQKTASARLTYKSYFVYCVFYAYCYITGYFKSLHLSLLLYFVYTLILH